MKIREWTEVGEADQPIWLARIREIFFASSARQTFTSDDEREEFWQKWTDYYFAHHPEHILLALENEVVQGYLMGCPDSMRALSSNFARLNPTFELFADQFAKFPAHLHINLAEQARGRGFGGELIDAFAKRLKKDGVRGLHIVTAPSARNVGFYTNEGFNTQIERKWREHSFLFMGREL